VGSEPELFVVLDEEVTVELGEVGVVDFDVVVEDMLVVVVV
jgi:hypothetical protein